ncbi:MAG: 6,7-dimethyl-8-ribityllumazine synthase [Pseudomonadota bacterium]|nr:6,7-dimethyl-8-ribityllumazine synthase [Pseudomonadota bacterium]
MNTFGVIKGQLQIRDAMIGVIATRFNGFIVEHLLAGALDALRQHGIGEDSVEIARVPGAFELALAAKAMAKRGKYDALIALGCVIRGATPHFEYIASECARGLSTIALEFDLPVAFGVLTTETIEQAIERAGAKGGNKGADAAVTALEMIGLLRELNV